MQSLKTKVTFLPKKYLKIFLCEHAPSKNVIKREASRKKGTLSCCKCIFWKIGANLADILIHVCPKMHFCQNLQAPMG